VVAGVVRPTLGAPLTGHAAGMPRQGLCNPAQHRLCGGGEQISPESMTASAARTAAARRGWNVTVQEA